MRFFIQKEFVNYKHLTERQFKLLKPTECTRTTKNNALKTNILCQIIAICIYTHPSKIALLGSNGYHQ